MARPLAIANEEEMKVLLGLWKNNRPASATEQDILTDLKQHNEDMIVVPGVTLGWWEEEGKLVYKPMWAFVVWWCVGWSWSWSATHGEIKYWQGAYWGNGKIPHTTHPRMMSMLDRGP